MLAVEALAAEAREVGRSWETGCMAEPRDSFCLPTEGSGMRRGFPEELGWQQIP